jgi:hypothetical protein
MTKGNQIRLTYDQKKAPCSAKSQNVKLTQHGLINVAEKKFGLKPSIAAIQRLGKRDEILNLRISEMIKKKKGGAKFPKLDEAVDI